MFDKRRFLKSVIGLAIFLNLLVCLHTAKGSNKTKQKTAAYDAYHEKFYPDSNYIYAEIDGKVVSKVKCERIYLDYPEIVSRGEANTAIGPNGWIWAAVGYNVSRGKAATGPERLFCSKNGGKTWTSNTLPSTKSCRLQAFTALKDGSLITAIGGQARKSIKIYVSKDKGQTWQQTTTIKAEPFEGIGEGFMSMTQLDDGRILFPVRRWIRKTEEWIPETKKNMLNRALGNHSVFVAKDGGKSFTEAYTTFYQCAETQIIQLKSGNLLGAFRHQRDRRWWDTTENLTALGAPDTPYPFKHVFIGDSNDSGRTWQNLRPVCDKAGKALIGFGECHGQLVQTADGRVVLVHGNRYPSQHGEIRARVSCDEGKTWLPEVYHMAHGRGYASSVALPDGTIVTITGEVALAKGPVKTPCLVVAIRWKLPEQ